MTDDEIARAAEQALKEIGSGAGVSSVLRLPDKPSAWNISFSGGPEVPDDLIVERVGSESLAAVQNKIRSELERREE